MGRRAKQNALLTVWLILPFAVIALLMFWIFRSFSTGPAMDEPGVGAGAGDTGGANAVGELMSGEDEEEG